jgi:hypothetical protein
MSVGPASLFDTLPRAIHEAAGESRRRIVLDIRSTDDPIRKAAGCLAFGYSVAGEGFAHFGNAEGAGSVVAAPLQIAKGTLLPDSGGRLVHLTNARAGASIDQSGTLVGNVYAGPLSNAGQTGLGVTVRTGLSPSAYEVAVPVPQAARGAFSGVTPIGPLTTWQYFFGQHYTACGTLSLESGEFLVQGANLNQAMFYLLDTGVTGGTVVLINRPFEGNGHDAPKAN